MPGSRIVCVAEYGPPSSLPLQAAQLGMEAPRLRRLLEQASHRIGTALSVPNPIRVEGEGFRALDFAGVVRLAPGVELEVVPKFLNVEDTAWREDFFAVATLARFGRIFPRETLRAAPGIRGDLTDLIARAFVSLYDRNQRQPLRQYRYRTWESFAIDGEIDEESAVLPGADGFLQSGLTLDRRNPYNRVMRDAMADLVPTIRSGDVRRQTAQRALQLSPQTDQPRSLRKDVPSRHRRWQDLYDLSLDVLKGLGVRYATSLSGVASLPGYVIKTDLAWESLLRKALRFGLPDLRVEKVSHVLGTRSAILENSTVSSRKLDPTPDATIFLPNGKRVPVDAKYKTSISGLTMSTDDIYEALAFILATGSNVCVLLYPAPPHEDLSRMPVGSTRFFERINVGDVSVLGAAVNVRGMSAAGGFAGFAESLAGRLRPLLMPEATPSATTRPTSGARPS